MKRLLVSLALWLSATIAVSAADLPVRVGESPGVAPGFVMGPSYSWTGFYLGINGGYGWGNYEIEAVGVTVSPFDLRGAVFGGQFGYNYQSRGFVIGFEIDGQWANINATQAALGVTLTEKIDWFMTARLRAGVTTNNVLLYATGGYAHGGFKVSATGGGASITSSENRGGWTAGGGVEFGWGQVSLKAEYLYLRSFDDDFTILGTPVSDRVQAHIARAGLNYRFGGGPVVARY